MPSGRGGPGGRCAGHGGSHEAEADQGVIFQLSQPCSETALLFCAQIEEIQESAALAMAAAMTRERIEVPAMGRAVDTAFVGPDSWGAAPAGRWHWDSSGFDPAQRLASGRQQDRCGARRLAFGAATPCIYKHIFALSGHLELAAAAALRSTLQNGGLPQEPLLCRPGRADVCCGLSQVLLFEPEPEPAS